MIWSEDATFRFSQELLVFAMEGAASNIENQQKIFDLGGTQKTVQLVSSDRVSSGWKKGKRLIRASELVFGKLNLSKDILLEIKTTYTSKSMILTTK